MTIFLHRHIFYYITVFVGLICLLTNCSSTRFIYTFIDEFIKDEITYFLDLDEEKKVLLNQQVSEMVDWHRKYILPKYANYLSNMADKLEANKYGPFDIKELLEDGKYLIEETVTGLTPYASKFLIKNQNFESIKFMEKRMLKRRQERIIELSKPEDILYEKRLERLIINFERFFGNLEDSQIILVEAHARMTLNESRVRLHNRTLRQKTFIRFLSIQPTEVELTNYLNKLLLNGHTITNPSYKNFSEISLQRFHALLVNILAISSTMQREKIVKKLRGYAADFKAVSMRGI